MAVCCCSLAGTAACRTCSNNPFAETPPPVRTYTVSAADTVLVTGQKTNADRDMRIPSTNRTNSAIGGEKRTNGDAIRAMTDEELAKLLTDVAQKSADKLCESLKTVEVDLSNCNFHILYEAHLDWLKQECKT